MSDAPIQGIKIIRHNAARVNNLDDPSLPYKVDIQLKAPSFMEIAFIAVHGGTEDICVRAETEEQVERFLEKYGFRTHPRLISLKIEGPTCQS